MKTFSFALLVFFGLAFSFAQETIAETLETYNDGSVPYITVEELAIAMKPVLLDTRKKEEFDVSRLMGATWVGYEEFDSNKVVKLVADKNTKIVVYCSVGVRSEEIGEKLKALGYTDVKNLYGGIFEWKNKDYPVVDAKGRETNKVHAFDREWGKLLKKGKKIYFKKETNH